MTDQTEHREPDPPAVRRRPTQDDVDESWDGESEPLIQQFTRKICDIHERIDSFNLDGVTKERRP